MKTMIKINNACSWPQNHGDCLDHTGGNDDAVAQDVGGGLIACRGRGEERETTACLKNHIAGGCEHFLFASDPDSIFDAKKKVMQ